jgi:PAS domain-containing protein
LFIAIAAFALGLFTIRRLRKNLVADSDSLNYIPLPADGLPVHAYQAVIQQLKQQKSELAAQQLSDRRKAKASDTLSSTILSNLSCGVLFFNTSGLVRQANPAARKLLGFASPVGLSTVDLFRTATLRPQNTAPVSPSLLESPDSDATVAQALAPALAGTSALHGLLLEYRNRQGENLLLELTASPVLADDASLMGTTLVLTDKTDLERFRLDRKLQTEISSELAVGLRHSLSTIADYARQLAATDDATQARQLADAIAHEAVQFDGSFAGSPDLAKARGATAGS